MSISEWLIDAERRLKATEVATARLDALVLLEDVLDKDRARLLAYPETQLSDVHIRTLGRRIARRALHEPLAYIRGMTEFYGREFAVNKYVLEPRPESEAMIDILKALARDAQPGAPIDIVADVGSGSGTLGITAALELGLERVYFHDIDPATLKVARKNAKLHGVKGIFRESDLFVSRGVSKPRAAYDAVLANLPYVPDKYQINEAARHEPRIAIFAGPDGLDAYRKLFSQAAAMVERPRYILTESMPPQHAGLVGIAAKNGYKVIMDEDFVQVFELD